MSATALSGFLTGLADGSLQVIDLTTPLSSSTPALRLPAPFVNLIDFSLEEVSAYNEPGPYWRHNNIHTGEHIGTHLDAPIHWISGRDGDDVSQIPVQRLIGPAAVLDLTAQVADNPDYLLEVADVEAWEADHGELLPGAWLLLRTGWESRGGSEAEFLNVDETGSHTPASRSSARSGWPRSGRSPGSASRPSASTPSRGWFRSGLPRPLPLPRQRQVRPDLAPQPRFAAGDRRRDRRQPAPDRRWYR